MKIEFDDLGCVTIKRLTKKAVLVEFDDADKTQKWIPLSVVSTKTAAQCEEGNVIANFCVESWFAEKME